MAVARLSPLLDVDRYLARIGFDREPAVDLATLVALHRAHLTAVPFENLDVYAGIPVTTDPARTMAKILDRGRGGWCFELNGAFAGLLAALGFDVVLLGAAVLLDGPTTVIDHLALEVALDEPWLVDVGFGVGFIRPLALNRSGPQDGETGTYELLASPQGTTLAHHDDGVPRAQYRFKRVGHVLADFEPVSERLQGTRSLHWHQRAFATRLLDGGPDRVSLTGNRLRVRRGGTVTDTDVPDDHWAETCAAWFGFRPDIDPPFDREEPAR